jgi:pSer/pThr/pTyr-binding forkhead associated (FHA) protein
VNDDAHDTVRSVPRERVEAPAPDVDDTVITAPTTLPSSLQAPDQVADTAPMADLPLDRAVAHNYGFRVGEKGRTVLLDVTAFVGRAPRSPRIQHGVLPRLIRVVSPRNEVSATHLGIRQLGASVIVTDLGSTNGTVVASPGSVPRSLRQGESVVVMPGTLVDIGDGNVIEILPVQRRREEPSPDRVVGTR